MILNIPHNLERIRGEGSAQRRARSWSPIGGDRWSIDSRDGTFPGRCAARVRPGRSTRADSMNSKETRHALPFLPSARPSITAESRLAIVPRTQTINETRGSESQGADNRRGMSSNRERDSWVRFKGIYASRRTSPTASITSGFCRLPHDCPPFFFSRGGHLRSRGIF